MSSHALSVDPVQLRTYASSLGEEVDQVRADTQSVIEALSAHGPALGGSAAEGVAALAEAWANADNAYIKRLADTADHVTSSAEHYETTDVGHSHALALRAEGTVD